MRLFFKRRQYSKGKNYPVNVTRSQRQFLPRVTSATCRQSQNTVPYFSKRPLIIYQIVKSVSGFNQEANVTETECIINKRGAIVRSAAGAGGGERLGRGSHKASTAGAGKRFRFETSSGRQGICFDNTSATRVWAPRVSGTGARSAPVVCFARTAEFKPRSAKKFAVSSKAICFFSNKILGQKRLLRFWQEVERLIQLFTFPLLSCQKPLSQNEKPQRFSDLSYTPVFQKMRLHQPEISHRQLGMGQQGKSENRWFTARLMRMQCESFRPVQWQDAAILFTALRVFLSTRLLPELPEVTEIDAVPRATAIITTKTCERRQPSMLEQNGQLHFCAQSIGETAEFGKTWKLKWKLQQVF